MHLLASTTLLLDLFRMVDVLQELLFHVLEGVLTLALLARFAVVESQVRFLVVTATVFHDVRVEGESFHKCVLISQTAWSKVVTADAVLHLLVPQLSDDLVAYVERVVVVHKHQWT